LGSLLPPSPYTHGEAGAVTSAGFSFFTSSFGSLAYAIYYKFAGAVEVKNAPLILF
jgi:hypothetical protein